ncbi:MAG: hypothetical protein ACTSQF_03100 [Candidatus Heimdallarchaeaceae archaeon]
MMTEQTEDIISALTGTALRVFVYSLKKGKDIGVRETHRNLGLKTASHAQYHLQRLEQLGLLGRDKNNKYFLDEEYENLRSLKIGILTEIYVFRGWLIPSLGLASGFIAMSLVITLLFFFLISEAVAAYFAIAVMFLAVIFTGFRATQIIGSFKQQEE